MFEGPGSSTSLQLLYYTYYSIFIRMELFVSIGNFFAIIFSAEIKIADMARWVDEYVIIVIFLRKKRR